MSRDAHALRRALAAAGAAGAAALAASATSGAAGTPPPVNRDAHGTRNAAPVASIRIKHRRIKAGTRVLLDASRSHDPDGRIVRYLWDLDGDGVFEWSTGRKPRVRHTFKKPGKVRVGLLVVDDKGGYATRTARVRAIGPRGGSHATYGDGKRERGAQRHRARPRARAATQRKKAAKHAKPSSNPAPSSATLHAAATSSGVTIKSFKFKPKTITIKVGDTVVWTNRDATAHSATADDGSFDTGLLTNGNTGSFRFTTAGTFTYHCTPHPTSMKGTVIVKGSGGSGSNGGSNSGSNGNSNSGSNSTNGSRLPHTGLEIASVVFAGLALIGLGGALRRRLVRG